MVQRTAQTINPAGSPIVQRTGPRPPELARAKFIRDLEKVALKKSGDSERSPRDEA
jgi:hypothetical protein